MPKNVLLTSDPRGSTVNNASLTEKYEPLQAPIWMRTTMIPQQSLTKKHCLGSTRRFHTFMYFCGFYYAFSMDRNPGKHIRTKKQQITYCGLSSASFMQMEVSNADQPSRASIQPCFPGLRPTMPPSNQPCFPGNRASNQPCFPGLRPTALKITNIKRR